MQRLISLYKDKTQTPQDGYIPALDGIRVFMVFSVAAFHFWQQSWLTPAFVIFGKVYSLDYFLRSAYLWVDGLLLLSGFLLYLPYVQAAEGGKKPLPVITFYKRRMVRILPSYILCLLIMLFFEALPGRAYPSISALFADLFAHLTFTHNLFPETYLRTPLNGALWTLAVEMQFYLIFPFLARSFRKQPILTYTLMTLAAFLFRAYALTLPDKQMYFNQMPAFLDVYANGFVAASCYAAISRKMKEDTWLRIFMTACAACAFSMVLYLCQMQAAESSIQQIQNGQMLRRFPLSVLLSLMIIGVSLGLGGIRLLLGNKITRRLSEISYNFYIWHQVFSIWLKKWGVPASAVANPHMEGDRVWQIRYVILCFLGATLLATLTTYAVERPMARRLNHLTK